MLHITFWVSMHKEDKTGCSQQLYMRNDEKHGAVPTKLSKKDHIQQAGSCSLCAQDPDPEILRKHFG